MMSPLKRYGIEKDRWRGWLYFWAAMAGIVVVIVLGTVLKR